MPCLPSNSEGYPLYYVSPMGGMLQCGECAQADIDADLVNPDEVSGQVYWEGPSKFCEDCGAELQSAYGDPADNTIDTGEDDE